MMPDVMYLEARRRARYHVQVELVRVDPVGQTPSNAKVHATVSRVFRTDGALNVDEDVCFYVSVRREGDDTPAGATVWTNLDDLVSARFMEVFLDGLPPDCRLVDWQSRIIDNISEAPMLPVPTKDDLAARWKDFRLKRAEIRARDKTAGLSDAEIVERFRQFAGHSDNLLQPVFGRFVGELFTYARDKGRLRFPMERLWENFLTTSGLEGPRDLDELWQIFAPQMTVHEPPRHQHTSVVAEIEARCGQECVYREKFIVAHVKMSRVEFRNLCLNIELIDMGTPGFAGLIDLKAAGFTVRPVPVRNDKDEPTVQFSIGAAWQCFSYSGDILSIPYAGCLYFDAALLSHLSETAERVKNRNFTDRSKALCAQINKWRR